MWAVVVVVFLVVMVVVVVKTAHSGGVCFLWGGDMKKLNLAGSNKILHTGDTLLLTNADSRTDTNLKRLCDLLKKKKKKFYER